ncbi:MAG: type I restriction enzyme HsdR N-terminal domain-containing protein [Candidatus Rokuibacteriota bacterium]
MKAKDEGLNEADTVQRIILFLSEVLGYDPLSEISRESQVRDKYVDIAVKIDGTVRWLIEAKAAPVSLRSRHLDQAELYAAESNQPWVVLTNGVCWHLYHLTFDEGIEYDRVFEVDLSTTDDMERAAELLGLLHRSAIIKGQHEDYLRHRQALDPESLAKAMFSYEALTLVRRLLRRREGVLLDVEDVAAAIKELFSTEARERIGTIRIQRRRMNRRKGPGDESPPASAGSRTPAAPSEAPSAPSRASPAEPPPAAR